MKKFITLTVLLALLVVSLFSVASAAGPAGTYVSGIACVNLESGAGTFSIDFYNAAGTKVTSLSNVAISGNGSKQYMTTAISGLPSGFMGSAVVSSDVQLACSVNTQTNGGLLRVGTSNGLSSTSVGKKLYVTQIMNTLGGTWSSYVAVQNTSGAAADVVAKYFDKNGAQVFTVTKNIPAYSTHVFYQDGDEDGNSSGDLPGGFIGAATFESTTADLAGTVAMYNSGADMSTAQFLSYNAFTSGSPKIYGPRIVKNLSAQGWTSGFSCQNVSSGPVNVTATFSVKDQVTNANLSTTMSKTGLAASQAWAVYMGGTGNATLDGSAQFVGSVIFEATGGNIACTFNEDNRTTYAGLGSTFGGVADGQQTTTMFFSQIVALGASSYRGGFQIANTTGTATTCTYTFSNGDVISNVPLGANGSNSVFAESVLTNNKTNFNGSAIVTCGQPIVGIYNLASVTTAGDSFATNNGINKP